MSRSGDLLFTSPDLTHDPITRYGLAVNPYFSRFPCEHVDPNGSPCPLTTSLFAHIGDTRYCFFHHPATRGMVGRVPSFDEAVRAASSLPLSKDQDRVSIYYAADLFRHLLAFGDEIDLVVETCCGTGGLTVLLARQDRDYVLVDEEEACLIATYERLARIDPEKAARLILFHGTFEEFVESRGPALVNRRIHAILDPIRRKSRAQSLLQAAMRLGPALHSFSLCDTMLRSRDPQRDMFVDEALDEVSQSTPSEVQRLSLGLVADGKYVLPPHFSVDPEDLEYVIGRPEGYLVRLAPKARLATRIRHLLFGRPARATQSPAAPDQLASWRVGSSNSPSAADSSPYFTPLDATRRPIKDGKLHLLQGTRVPVAPARRFWRETETGRVSLPADQRTEILSADPSVIGVHSTSQHPADSELQATGVGTAEVTLTCSGAQAGRTAEVLPEGQTLSPNLYRPFYHVQVETRHRNLPPGPPSLAQDEFFRHMRERKNPRILEIGSRHVIATLPKDQAGEGATFVGLDIIEGKNVDVVGDAHRLSELFPPDSFDGVFSIAVFEHIAMPWKVALEVSKVLKPGGFCYIGSHHSYCLHEMPWDFWRYGRHSFSATFDPGLGYTIEAETLGWSAHLALSLPGGWQVIGDGCYLYAHILAQKTGSVDEESFRWDIDLKEILPEGHFYPAGTGYSRNAAAKKAIADLECFQTSFGPWERLFETAIAQTQSATPASPPRVLLLAGTNSRVDRENGRDLEWWRTQLNFQLSGAQVEVLNLADSGHDTGEALFHSLPSRFEQGSFDAIFSIGSLALLPRPWTAPLTLAKLLRVGGLLFAKETQVRPVEAGVPDLWRFSSETLRVLFNTRTGFEVGSSVVSDRAYLLPDELTDPSFFRYNLNIPCFESATCLARRVEPAEGSELRWG